MIAQTHQLIDEQGIAVLSGSQSQMEAELAALIELGYTSCHIEPIAALEWHWESVDWGD